MLIDGGPQDTMETEEREGKAGFLSSSNDILGSKDKNKGVTRQIKHICDETSMIFKSSLKKIQNVPETAGSVM